MGPWWKAQGLVSKASVHCGGAMWKRLGPQGVGVGKRCGVLQMSPFMRSLGGTGCWGGSSERIVGRQSFVFGSYLET